MEAAKALNFYAAANLFHGKKKAKVMKAALGFISAKSAAYGGNEKAKKKLDELKAGVESLNVKVTGETNDGDYAVVDIVVSGSPDGKNGPEKTYLKKVDGEWKIMDAEEYKREKANR